MSIIKSEIAAFVVLSTLVAGVAADAREARPTPPAPAATRATSAADLAALAPAARTMVQTTVPFYIATWVRESGRGSPAQLADLERREAAIRAAREALEAAATASEVRRAEAERALEAARADYATRTEQLYAELDLSRERLAAVRRELIAQAVVLSPREIELRQRFVDGDEQRDVFDKIEALQDLRHRALNVAVAELDLAEARGAAQRYAAALTAGASGYSAAGRHAAWEIALLKGPTDVDVLIETIRSIRGTAPPADDPDRVARLAAVALRLADTPARRRAALVESARDALEADDPTRALIILRKAEALAPGESVTAEGTTMRAVAARLTATAELARGNARRAVFAAWRSLALLNAPGGSAAIEIDRIDALEILAKAEFRVGTQAALMRALVAADEAVRLSRVANNRSALASSLVTLALVAPSTRARDAIKEALPTLRAIAIGDNSSATAARELAAGLSVASRISGTGVTLADLDAHLQSMIDRGLASEKDRRDFGLRPPRSTAKSVRG